MTVCEYFVGVPDLAAFKHARVHDVGAHEGRLHSFELVGQQLVGQRLVEAHCGKFTGTVILSQTKKSNLFTLSAQISGIYSMTPQTLSDCCFFWWYMCLNMWISLLTCV